MTYDPKRTRRPAPRTSEETAVDALLGPAPDEAPDDAATDAEEPAPAADAPTDDAAASVLPDEPAADAPTGGAAGPDAAVSGAGIGRGDVSGTAAGIATPRAVESWVLRTAWRPVLAALVAVVVVLWLLRRRER